MTGLSALELLHQGIRLYRFYSPADLYPETQLIRFLRAQSPPFRIVGAEGALFPNTNVFASVESIGTHDPAERRDYVRLLDLAAGYPTFDYFKVVRDLDAPILDLLNVRFLVSSADGKSPGARWIPVYAGEDGRVFENRGALPRFYAPPEVEVVRRSPGAPPTGRNALPAYGPRLEELLTTGAFARRALVLENRAFPPAGVVDNPSVAVGQVVEKTNTVRFSASVSGLRSSVLISSLVTDGGWSAQDEHGKQLSVGLATGPFLALVVPPGEHVVTLTYWPPGFRIGSVLSLLTLVALAAAILFWRRSERGVSAV
jgi:hypothetical protein